MAASAVQPVLFHCAGARSLRALWALRELRAAGCGPASYRLVTMPFPPRVAARAFLQLNALGTVPLLLHGKQRMTEVGALAREATHGARATTSAAPH